MKALPPRQSPIDPQTWTIDIYDDKNDRVIRVFGNNSKEVVELTARILRGLSAVAVAVFMTAHTVMGLHETQIPLQTAGQISAPTCVEYCVQAPPAGTWYWHKCEGGAIFCPKFEPEVIPC